MGAGACCDALNSTVLVPNLRAAANTGDHHLAASSHGAHLLGCHRQAVRIGWRVVGELDPAAVLIVQPSELGATVGLCMDWSGDGGGSDRREKEVFHGGMQKRNLWGTIRERQQAERAAGVHPIFRQ